MTKIHPVSIQYCTHENIAPTKSSVTSKTWSRSPPIAPQATDEHPAAVCACAYLFVDGEEEEQGEDGPLEHDQELRVEAEDVGDGPLLGQAGLVQELVHDVGVGLNREPARSHLAVFIKFSCAGILGV